MAEQLSRRRIVKRALLVVVLVPLMYGSTFVTTSFLHGAGAVSPPAFQFLCDTVFAPLLWLDGSSQVTSGRFNLSPRGPGRLAWLFDTAFEACHWGYKLTH